MTGIDSLLVRAPTVAVLVARLLQSLMHVSFLQSSRSVALRFTSFLVRTTAFLRLIGIVALGAGSPQPFVTVRIAAYPRTTPQAVAAASL